MPTEATNEATRAEWRDLGFFYDCEDANSLWRISGSRKGLLSFATVLKRYAADPRNAAVSEHDHFGPYMCLKLITWPTPNITDHAIFGPLPALAALGADVETAVAGMNPGDTRSLRNSFAPDAPYDLVLDLHDDSFDPAKADAGC